MFPRIRFRRVSLILLPLLAACAPPAPEKEGSPSPGPARVAEASPAGGQPAAAPAPSGGGGEAPAPAAPENAAPPESSASAAGELEFPADRSLGILKYYDAAKMTWTEIGPAKGRVAADPKAGLMLAVGAEGIADLSPLEKLDPAALQSISFDGLKIPPGGLAPLVKLTGLKKVILRGAELADADLAPLAALPNLEELDLAITGIGDAGMEALKTAPALQTLDISGTKVSDAAIPALAAMAKLSYLDPQKSMITPEEGVARLQEAMPSCTIVVR